MSKLSLSRGLGWAVRLVAFTTFAAARTQRANNICRTFLTYLNISDSTLVRVFFILESRLQGTEVPQLLLPAGLFFTLSILNAAKPLPSRAAQANKQTRKGEKKHPPRTSATAPLTTYKAQIISVIFFAAWSLTAPSILRAPVLKKPLDFTYTHPQLPVRILSSEQSITGTIVVGEGLRAPPELNVSRTMQSVRYLRADHSIIGTATHPLSS